MYFLKLYLYLLKAQTKLLLLFSLVKLRKRIKSQIRVSRFRTDGTAINELWTPWISSVLRFFYAVLQNYPKICSQQKFQSLEPKKIVPQNMVMLL